MSVTADWKERIEGMSQRFPWYRQLQQHRRQDALHANQAAGSGPASELALRQLPLITASVLEQHYYTDGNPLAGRSDHYGYRTSGTSSGRRKTIYYSEQDEEAYLRIKLDVFRAILAPFGYRTAIADVGTGHAEATAAFVFRSMGMEVHSLSYRLPVEQHIEQLARIKPEVLYTMPSMLDRILLAADDPSAWGICHVVLVGEMASPGWIARVAERLHIGEERITDTYGSIEIGTIAYYSHEHGRYLFAEGITAEGIGPEALEEDLEPLPAGEQVLVLTSAVREAFPALRYVTYDVVRDLRPISVDGAGSMRMSFRSIVKRIGPDLKHGEKISIYDIEEVVYRHLGDAAIRVQVAGNALRVHLYSQHAGADLLERIRSELENHIPAIGAMIQGGMLGGIEVIGSARDDALDLASRSAVKNKKIYYT
jgi:phenylacetate-coenzyme A ligase PaaK-like adenylate-forming protein